LPGLGSDLGIAPGRLDTAGPGQDFAGWYAQPTVRILMIPVLHPMLTIFSCARRANLDHTRP
jgi:hypothetical protein